MNKTVHTLDFEKILRILKDSEDKYVFEKVNLIPKEDELLDKLQKYINYGQVNRKAVLGIDIYKYSSYEEFAQTLVVVSRNNRHVFQKPCVPFSEIHKN